MRRALLVVVVVSTVVAAGCFGGPSGTDTATETASPAPDTGTPEGGETGTSTPSDGLPPGVESDGTVDGGVLETAHYRAIQGSSFRIDVSETGGPNPRSFTLYNGTGTARIEFGAPGGGGTFYLANDVVTVHNDDQSPPNTYSYGTTNQGSVAGATYLSLIGVYPARYLSVGTFEADGTVTRDGEELTRLAATGVNATAVAERESSFSRGNLTDMSGTVLVRSDGLVREMHLNQTFETGDTGDLEFTLAGIGATSVEEPDWIDQAPRLEGSLSANGTVLELEHVGGPAIPAGTTLELAFGDLREDLAPSNATLAEPVSTGDTVSVYAPGNLLSPGVEVSVNGGAAPDDAMDLSQFDTQVSGTVGDVRFVVGVPDDDSDDS